MAVARVTKFSWVTFSNEIWVKWRRRPVGPSRRAAVVSGEFYEKMLSQEKSVTIDPVERPRNSGSNITHIIFSTVFSQIREFFHKFTSFFKKLASFFNQFASFSKNSWVLFVSFFRKLTSFFKLKKTRELTPSQHSYGRVN